jgi:hypothetical protein
MLSVVILNVVVPKLLDVCDELQFLSLLKKLTLICQTMVFLKKA